MIYGSCLLPKMTLSLVLEGRYIGYKSNNWLTNFRIFCRNRVAVQLQKNLDRVRLKRVASKSKNGTLGGYLISSHPSGLLIATKQLYVLCSFIELRLFEFQDPYLMTHINLVRFLNLCMMLHQSSTLLLKMLLLSMFLLIMLLFSTFLHSTLIPQIKVYWVVGNNFLLIIY